MSCDAPLWRSGVIDPMLPARQGAGTIGRYNSQEGAPTAEDEGAPVRLLQLSTLSRQPCRPGQRSAAAGGQTLPSIP